MNISAALTQGRKEIACATDVPLLEAEILLSHSLQVSRAHLHTWPEKNLEEIQQEMFLGWIARRKKGEPIAYITGHKEFWSLDFLVAPDVLIPRPETELLVELVLSHHLPSHRQNTSLTIADLGTGPGTIALSIAHSRPSWVVHATDVSPEALTLAQINAERFQVKNVTFHQGDWCGALPIIPFDIIVSNPPYIAEEDEHLSRGDVRFEPRRALVSAEHGLQDIQQIINESRDYLRPGGLLLIEHGSQQAKNVSAIFEKAGYNYIHTQKDLSQLDRVTFATFGHF